MGDIGKGLGEALMLFGLVAVFGLVALLCGAGFFVASFLVPVSATTTAISMFVSGLVAAWATKHFLFAD